MKYVIKLQENTFLADWDGDPGRTVIKTNAKTFEARKPAQEFLRKTKEQYPFRIFDNAEIEII